MRFDPHPPAHNDDWLESQCRRVEAAGQELAEVVEGVNARTEHAVQGALGRRQRITETQLRQAEAAWRSLHDVQLSIQDALFDCEHELRALRERELSPAELLIDGERLIRQYRFLRRRARVIDGLLAYLPAVGTHAAACVDHLRRLRDGAEAALLLAAPDCGFALVAMEELGESLDRRR